MFQIVSPGRMALRDFLLCLMICIIVVSFDADALRNPVRLAVMCLVIIAVPAGNYFMARRRARAAR